MALLGLNLSKTVFHALAPGGSYGQFLARTKASSSTRVFDEELLKWLACPLTKQSLRYDKEAQELVNDALGVAYPIIRGIPHIMPTEGRLLDANVAKVE